jgi:hypothetical protein
LNLPIQASANERGQHTLPLFYFGAFAKSSREWQSASPAANPEPRKKGQHGCPFFFANFRQKFPGQVQEAGNGFACRSSRSPEEAA